MNHALTSWEAKTDTMQILFSIREKCDQSWLENAFMQMKMVCSIGMKFDIY
jgi:hypothetical protein